jgi:putative peptide zinc metalloprotease protein
MKQIEYANIIPKINPDIDISHRDNEYIISLKGSNFHLKISPKLFDLLGLVDNSKNISQIVLEFNKYFQTQIDIKLVYNKLGHYDIIENCESNFDDNAQPSYLKLNFILINSATTRVLSKPFLFLFSSTALKVLISISLLTSIVTVIANYNDFYMNLKDISVEYFALYTGLMIFSSLLHELGHASATFKFGGEHSGIGVGFYLFTPVMYANVSSAWKLDVGKRIIVNLAGIYFELLFATLLILISFITGITSLLIVPPIILFKTLYNLNPFFRTDGYWVLSDAIRTPNLRHTSNELLKKFFKSILSIKLNGRDIFLIIYAFISNAFIFVFLFYLLILNPNSLVTFPIDVYNYIDQILNNKTEISTSGISHFLIPATFYFLLIRFLINFIKKNVSNKKK